MVPSLQELYNNKIKTYLFWLKLAKLASILFIIIGLGIIFFFHSWWRYVPGVLLIVIGSLVRITAALAHQKLMPIINACGTAIGMSESYAADKAKEFINKKLFNNDDQ